jgi:thioredoxin-related protein
MRERKATGLKSLTAALVMLTLASAWLLAAAQPAGQASDPAKPVTGVAYTLPQWFKSSFLDFRQDVAEARKLGRHVMVFLHLDNCPYCARLLEENFVSGDNYDIMRKHFDVIAVNVRGSLDVTWTDGVAYTERTVTQHLGIRSTPTLIFLGEDGRQLARLNGYQDPGTLRSTLEFVRRKR